MTPRRKLPNVSHLINKRVQPSLRNSPPKRRLMHPRRTSSDNNPIQLVIPNALPNLFLPRVGTRITIRLNINHSGQFTRILSYIFNINGSSNVEPTVTDKHTDARLASRLRSLRN